jgi:site-specific DNA-methyltransferase (adenine-specific)
MGSKGSNPWWGSGAKPLDLLALEAKAWTVVTSLSGFPLNHPCPNIALATGDALAWLRALPADTLHAIVTDPPYGLLEYQKKDHDKLRQGQGGVWRLPPVLDGVERAPLPRFTVLTGEDRKRLEVFFGDFATLAYRGLVPGGHLIIASNPLLSTTTFGCFEQAGFEKRGEIIRLVQTLRGGDRPKGAERDFCGVTVMPRSCWEPWGLFRKPLSERTVAANLRRWGTGGLRRLSPAEPFRDVIPSAPTRAAERKIAPHPSLKPQRFMRQLVRAVLPLGLGVLYDPFTGGGSTLAAAARLGTKAIGTERDPDYAALACRAIPGLCGLHGEDDADG